MPTTRPNRPETRSIRRQYTSSGSGDSGVKVQFPELPKEWRGKFVKGQMYKYQDTLPRLPVPALEQSLRKYLDTVKVVIPMHSVLYIKGSSIFHQGSVLHNNIGYICLLESPEICLLCPYYWSIVVGNRELLKLGCGQVMCIILIKTVKHTRI